MGINQMQRREAHKEFDRISRENYREIKKRHSTEEKEATDREIDAGIRRLKFKIKRKGLIKGYHSIRDVFDVGDVEEKVDKRAYRAEEKSFSNFRHKVNMLIIFQDVGGDEIAEALTALRDWKFKKSS